MAGCRTGAVGGLRLSCSLWPAPLLIKVAPAFSQWRAFRRGSPGALALGGNASALAPSGSSFDTRTVAVVPQDAKRRRPRDSPRGHRERQRLTVEGSLGATGTVHPSCIGSRSDRDNGRKPRERRGHRALIPCRMGYHTCGWAEMSPPFFRVPRGPWLVSFNGHRASENAGEHLWPAVSPPGASPGALALGT